MPSFKIFVRLKGVFSRRLDATHDDRSVAFQITPTTRGDDAQDDSQRSPLDALGITEISNTPSQSLSSSKDDQDSKEPHTEPSEDAEVPKTPEITQQVEGSLHRSPEAGAIDRRASGVIPSIEFLCARGEYPIILDRMFSFRNPILYQSSLSQVLLSTSCDFRKCKTFSDGLEDVARQDETGNTLLMLQGVFVMEREHYQHIYLDVLYVSLLKTPDPASADVKISAIEAYAAEHLDIQEELTDMVGDFRSLFPTEHLEAEIVGSDV